MERLYSAVSRLHDWRFSDAVLFDGLDEGVGVEEVVPAGLPL